jgi:redox-sensitive bicupin YhaK (pirin superfamily)
MGETITMSSVVALCIEPVTKDLGEFTVARLLPDPRRQRIGPFIFFDHFGPAEFPPGKGVNVRAHPHIGLATITYLFEGTMLHRDSLGYVQEVEPGAVNWMTAGRGIVHSEKVTDDVLARGQRLHGLQTWVALPLESEEIAPRFEHYPADQIPRMDADGAQISVIVGSAYGLGSPVKTESETVYVEIHLESGASVELPQTEELAILLVSGEATVAGEPLVPGALAVLQNNAVATLRATTDAHIVICGGASLPGDRIVWWNFVSSSAERIERAKEDWQNGRFDPVPGEQEFIPLPDR